MPSLTVDGARTRAAALTVHSYDVDLDLTRGDHTFGSTTRIVFSASSQSSFLDVKPAELTSVTLNGEAVDVAGLSDGRLALTGLTAENELVVVASMLYSNDGEGLHRSVDAADGLTYLYAMSFLDAAPRIFACFDQPDLKAPYKVKVTAPPEWIVLGNGAATQVYPGRWELAETKPLSTYFVTLVAGPYHQILDSHDGIPLGLVSRQSLGEALDRDAEDIFTVTKQAFDEFHRLFGYRYPFGEYHQAFVPEFNAGAMENPGCVTFRDAMVFRSAVTDQERSGRARTVVHEMAHQWFGDTVTMQWWNDLWLNESFAEYMAHRVSTAATQYTDNWIDFAFVRKWWGLQADQRSSTHPIAADAVKDALASLDDFDGISYAKGAATLKQLAAYLGDDIFLAGVRAHITSNEFGNATFADLVAKWTEAGAVGLEEWAQNWLRTPGVDTISAERTATGVKLRRVAPAAYPANRPHQLTVGGFDESGRSVSVPVLLDSDEVEVELDPSLAVIVPDAADDTWAKIRLDADSLGRLAEVLPKIADGVTRAVVLNSLRDAIADAELDPQLGFDVVLAALPHEDSDIAVTTMVSWSLARLLGGYLPYEPHRGQLADVLAARVGSTPPGSSLQLAVVRGLVRVCVGRRPAQGLARGHRRTGGAGCRRRAAVGHHSAAGAARGDRRCGDRRRARPRPLLRGSGARDRVPRIAADARGQGTRLDADHDRRGRSQLRPVRRGDRLLAPEPGRRHRAVSSSATSLRSRRPRSFAPAGRWLGVRSWPSRGTRSTSGSSGWQRTWSRTSRSRPGSGGRSATRPTT